MASMEQAAQDLLEDVADAWVAGGVLGPLHRVVRQVWRSNLDRYERRLGDDSLTLGVQSSRNICNLSVRALAGVPDVLAVDRNTLEVTYQGRTLHTGKAPSGSLSWDVHSVEWDSSDVRIHGAEGNSAAYQPNKGTLFEAFGAVDGQQLDPSGLRYLHLLWQGLPDGNTRAWLGFPRAGDEPWFAVKQVDAADGGSGGLAEPVEGSPLVPPTTFDAIASPEPAVTRRPHRQRPALSS